MKKYITTVVALAVLVVVAAAAIIILSVNGNKSGSGDPADETPDTEYVRLFKYNVDNVAKAESASGESSYVVERSEDGEGNTVWLCTSDPSLKTYSSSVSSLISTIVSSSSAVPIRGVLNFRDYGFTEDRRSGIYVRLTTLEGLTDTVYVGDYDFSQSNRFVYLDDGSDTVYKLNARSADRMIIRKQDLIQMKAFTYLSTDVPERFIVYSKGEKLLELLCTGVDEEAGASWTVEHPIERESENGSVNDIISNLKEVPLNEISGELVAESELADYGLAPAEIEYYLFMKNKDGDLERYFIKVGFKSEDGNYYYCTVDDGIDGFYDVYTIDNRYINKSIDPLDYVNTYLYVKDSDLLSRVFIEIGGETHTMEYEYETVKGTGPKGEETEELVVTRFFNGDEAVDDDAYCIVINDNRFTPPTEEDIAKNRDNDITNDINTANPYEAFNHLLFSLYTNLCLSDIDLEEPSADVLGERVCAVTYTERDGSVYKIELFRRDNTTAYAYINGHYAGGYCRTTGLSGDDYRNGDYPASLKALKIVMGMIG